MEEVEKRLKAELKLKGYDRGKRVGNENGKRENRDTFTFDGKYM